MNELVRNTIGVDLDGTLLNQDYCVPGRGDHGMANRPPINVDVLHALKVRGLPVAILTNQGGLNWAGTPRSDGGMYPTPDLVAWRIASALVALRAVDVDCSSVRISLYHARAQREITEKAEYALRRSLKNEGIPDSVSATIYTTDRARKPFPLMLHSVGAIEHWGDSVEDLGAALSADVLFRHVPSYRVGGGNLATELAGRSLVDCMFFLQRGVREALGCRMIDAPAEKVAEQQQTAYLAAQAFARAAHFPGREFGSDGEQHSTRVMYDAGDKIWYVTEKGTGEPAQFSDAEEALKYLYTTWFDPAARNMLIYM